MEIIDYSIFPEHELHLPVIADREQMCGQRQGKMYEERDEHGTGHQCDDAHDQAERDGAEGFSHSFRQMKCRIQGNVHGHGGDRSEGGSHREQKNSAEQDFISQEIKEPGGAG